MHSPNDFRLFKSLGKREILQDVAGDADFRDRDAFFS